MDWVRQEALANTADEDEPAEHATDIAPWPPDADVAWAPPETRSYSPPWPPRGTPVLLRTAQVAELEGAVHVSGHAHTILRMAHLSSPEDFGPWLEATPVLWSLRYKPLVGDALLDELARSHNSVSAANMGLLARCFGWDDVHDGVDPDRLASIQSRGHRRWAAETGNAAELSALLEQEGSLRLGRITVSRCLRYLSQPWNLRRSLWQAQLPEHISEVNALLDAIESGGSEQLPEAWHPQQILFWRSLADVSRPRRWRWQVNALRGVLLGVCSLLFFGGIAGVSLVQGKAGEASIFVQMGALLGLLLAVMGVLWVPVRWALRQLTLDLTHRRAGLLLALPAPLMAIGSLVLVHGLGHRMEGTLLIFMALPLATARLWRRVGARMRFGVRHGVFMVLAMLIAEAGIVLTLLQWGAEFVHRARRHAPIDRLPPASGNTA
ncbi:heat-shock protein [Stenotrophomonas maltophilia]|uniref:heat-shock protein n=1 Tax=Stenotrophomonas maltophilia TaxID=40324 RepID=UPI0015E02B00|nr:heat-shock protein [Stenotrophomonas maltophilia]MBL0755872.1 heat-shock protein [Stenotrophomonas maltophilia]MCU1014614.1 heat-shock protein [Stenotrophomonas maltophilia]MCU1104600.1 heat-shock protein [Stenotrophomonas maltophilia]HEL3209765.1 heat-shock protein [Stenotrophomonas maltophilia]